jgi:phosphomannomutase
LAEPIISVSGLRGIVGETLTAEVAGRYAAAFAALAPPGAILVGRDSRPSGNMLSAAIQTALQAAGRDTLDAGVVATPTVGLLVRQAHAAGGIAVTASHNPPPYNGMKLFSAEGRVVPAALGQEVLARYRHPPAEHAFEQPPGTRQFVADPLSGHLEAVLATVDVARIRGCRFQVLLDSNHGAGGPLGVRLLESLGCRVTAQGAATDGRFQHPAEPTAENLAGVLSAVPAAGADVGFCQDPDADRLAVIDAAGRYLGEEYTVALCVEHVLRHRRGPVVVNCASSRMSADIALRHGVPLVRSAVGEANVVDAMLEHAAVFGGEGNGGPIDPRVGLVRDSFVGMAQLLDAMAERQMTIGQLAAELPRYEIVKIKVSLARDKLPAAFDALEAHFPAAEVDRLDGLRLDWPGRWLLVRGSNTEPTVRAIAEAPTEAEARRLCDSAAAVLARV